WYAYWWEGGRTRSRYLGKAPPAALAPEASSPASTPAGPVPAPILSVVTLGRFAVCRDGVELPEAAWLRRKAATLFKLLLGAPGHRLQRDQVLDLLWPDEDPQVANVSLRGATHAIRRALDPAPGNSVLQVHGGTLALAGGPALWVDADAFADAAGAALAGRDAEA